MSTFTAPDPRLLTQMGDEVGQLTRPYTIAVRQRGRKTKTRWVAVQHPPLLSQLDAACTPTLSSADWGKSRSHGNLMIPINVAASDALTTIVEGVGDWRWRVIPTHHAQQRWTVETLRALLGAAPTLAPSIAKELAGDIHHWWQLAAIHSGWNPSELRGCLN